MRFPGRWCGRGRLEAAEASVAVVMVAMVAMVATMLRWRRLGSWRRCWKHGGSTRRRCLTLCQSW